MADMSILKLHAGVCNFDQILILSLCECVRVILDLFHDCLLEEVLSYETDMTHSRSTVNGMMNMERD